MGRTALMFAASHGHLLCVKILAPREKGVRNRFHHTALHYAKFSTKSCAEFLWQFAEERNTDDLDEVEEQCGLQHPVIERRPWRRR